MLGHTIVPGDIVAYAVARYSSGYMQFGEIVEIWSHNKRGEQYTKSVWDGNTKRIVPDAALKIIILPVKNHDGRTSILTHLNKVIRYERHLLPDDYF